MAYLVLARKWRPQSFTDVVGQGHVTQTLANAIRQGRVAHAFLFTGSRGVGKTSTARILAKALNCQEGPTPTPCNQCTACVDITDGRAVDIIEIDGASNRGINEIREVREAVRYAPSRERYKVYIIDEVHMLTTEAFNALLKTLEEPPSHAVFVFATTEPNKIPVTILSRCQRYDFKRVTVRDLCERLRHIADAEGIDFTDEALTLLARHARGGVRDALSAMDQVIAFAEPPISAESAAETLGIASRETLHSLGEALVNRDVDRALRVLEKVDSYGQDLGHFSVDLLEHLRDMTVVCAVADPQGLTELGESELERVKAAVKNVSIERLQRMFQIWSEAVDLVVRSLYPKLLMEMTVVKMAAVAPMPPLLPLLSRLEALEKSLHGDLPREQDLLAKMRSHLAASLRDYAPLGSSGDALPAPSEPPPGEKKKPEALASRVSAPPSPPQPPPATTAATPHAPTKVEAQETRAGAMATAEVSPAESGDPWRSALRRLSPKVAGVMEQAVVVRLEPTALELALSDGLRGLLVEADLAALLDSLALELGARPRLRFVEAAPAATLSLAEERQQAREQHQEAMRERIRTHPLLGEAMTRFGVDASSVRIDLHLYEEDEG